MIIRRAVPADLPGLVKLLNQVLMVHYHGRPDLFKPHTRKYTDDELLAILADEAHPVFVAVDEDAAPGQLLGHAFCEVQYDPHSNNLQPVRTLYIDDICVDEGARGKHVGSSLYAYVKEWARERGFYNITLNVWTCNPAAIKFYEALGLVPYKVGMEEIL